MHEKTERLRQKLLVAVSHRVSSSRRALLDDSDSNSNGNMALDTTTKARNDDDDEDLSASSLSHQDQEEGDLFVAFRQKAAYVKGWRPAGNPSNRDRLELYALHEQAVWGDAPAPSNAIAQTGAERAKYSAWKSKAGTSRRDAMRRYVDECDRQIRKYGLTAATSNGDDNSIAGATPSADVSVASPRGGGGSPVAANSATATGGSGGGGGGYYRQPGGLAAIPLLCAAASESRRSYLRRLSNTSIERAWWGRQNPLCASRGTLWALPETAVIRFAALIERASLTAEGFVPLVPHAVVQSWLWPLHNSLLSLWMCIILTYTSWTSAYQLASTVLLGTRSTGHTLGGVWNDDVQTASRSIRTMMESHQPLTARLVGLWLLPYSLVVSVLSWPPVLAGSAMYCVAMALSWWYWCFVLPFLSFWMLSAAIVAGNCFGLLELVGA